MAQNVAFLRGMNLGRRRIKNEELCACFEDLGFEEVSAFLASGNVIFRARRVSEKMVEDGLRTRLDYEVPTFIRSSSELAAIARAEPFNQAITRTTKGNLQVVLLQTAPKAAAARQALALGTDTDHLKLDGRHLFWLPQSGISDSALDMKALERLLGPMTIRTHRTIVRLVAKLV